MADILVKDERKIEKTQFDIIMLEKRELNLLIQELKAIGQEMYFLKKQDIAIKKSIQDHAQYFGVVANRETQLSSLLILIKNLVKDSEDKQKLKKSDFLKGLGGEYERLAKGAKDFSGWLIKPGQITTAAQALTQYGHLVERYINQVHVILEVSKGYIEKKVNELRKKTGLTA